MQFNTQEALQNEPAQEDVVLIPPGEYPVICTESTLKRNKKNNGDVLHTTWKLGGASDQKGKSVKAFFNVDHENPEVARIGRVDLAKCCQAVGLPSTVEDVTIDLIGRKAIAKIESEKASANWSYDSNRIRKFKAYTVIPVPLPAAIEDDAIIF